MLVIISSPFGKGILLTSCQENSLSVILATESSPAGPWRRAISADNSGRGRGSFPDWSPSNQVGTTDRFKGAGGLGKSYVHAHATTHARFFETPPMISTRGLWSLKKSGCFSSYARTCSNLFSMQKTCRRLLHTCSPL